MKKVINENFTPRLSSKNCDRTGNMKLVPLMHSSLAYPLGEFLRTLRETFFWALRNIDVGLMKSQ